MQEHSHQSQSTGDSVESQLTKLETDLLKPEIRRNLETLSTLLADEFCEFGTSGQIYTRQQVIDALQTETPTQFSVTDLSVSVLTEDVALVRYRTSRHSESGQQNSVC